MFGKHLQLFCQVKYFLVNFTDLNMVQFDLMVHILINKTIEQFSFSIASSILGILLWLWLSVLWRWNLWDEGQERVWGKTL